MEEEHLLERLLKYPSLKKRMEKILDVLENTSGEVTLAGAAESCLIEEGRQLNQEALQYWAEQQAKRQADRFEQHHQQVRKSGKKN